MLCLKIFLRTTKRNNSPHILTCFVLFDSKKPNYLREYLKENTVFKDDVPGTLELKPYACLTSKKVAEIFTGIRSGALILIVHMLLGLEIIVQSFIIVSMQLIKLILSLSFFKVRVSTLVPL